MTTGNSKANDPHQIVLNSNKHVALQDLSIYYYTGENMRKQY